LRKRLLRIARRALQGTERPQGDEVEERERDRHLVAVPRDRRADGAGVPDAGCGRGAAHGAAVLQDRAAADEPHARHEAVEHARLAVGAVEDLDTEEDVGAARERDQRERAEARAAGMRLAVPRDRHREEISRAETQEVAEDVGEVDRVRVHHSRLAVADAADRRRSGPCAPELGGSRRVRNQLSCPSLAAPPREGSRAIPRPPPGFLRVVCKPFRDGRGRIATRTARPYPARRRGVARKVRAAARMHRYCPGLAGFVGTVSPAIVAIALLAACGGGGGGNADGSEGPKVPPPAPQENAPFRAIAGISMGAYGALNLGTKHPD